MSGRFIAVVGPSGVGKDTVMRALAAAEPRLECVRRTITRPGDAGGEDFDGVSQETFAQMELAGDFALSWTAHGLQYGIPATVHARLAAGADMLANLSRAMLATAADRFPGIEVIWLTATKEALAARLSSRGRETSDEITKRLARAECDISPPPGAHIMDNSGPLDRTVTTVLARLYPLSVAR